MTKTACTLKDIYHLFNRKGGDKNCSIKEGILFAFHEGWIVKRSNIDKGTKEERSAHERYAEKELRRPEYQRIRMRLGRLDRILVMIGNTCRQKSRTHSRRELGHMLKDLHEIETETEDIEDLYLRGYIYEKIDMIASERRSLAEEVRWDIESSNRPGKI